MGSRETDEIVYRGATALDVDRMMALNIATLPENYPKAHWISLLRDADSKGLSFVAVDSGNRKRILGYIIGHVLEDYADGLGGQKSRQIRVYSISTHERYRRRGIGGELVKRLVEGAGGRGLPITLHVRASNTPAIKLYTKHGFSILNTTPNYYSDPPEDALFMIRAPTPSST